MTDLSSSWLSDRSRFQMGLQQCLRKRYLTYHSITGYGIEGAKPALEAELGIALHEALALIMSWLMTAPGAQALSAEGRPSMPPRELIRSSIWTAQESLKAAMGWDIPESETDESFTIGEQLALLEALVWAWVRGQLAEFLKRFEIIGVEQEIPLDLGDGIVWQTRSDLILRQRDTRGLVIADWKSSSQKVESEEDSFVSSFLDDMQLAMNGLAVEAAMGERVEGAYVLALLKGGRGKFKRDGQTTPQARQYSELIYGCWAPPSPPLVKEPAFKAERFWAAKQPIWQAQLGQAAGQSAVERWVLELLPLPIVQASVAMLGPYPRPSQMMQSLPRQIKAHEREWIEKLWKLHADGLPWGSEVFQANLDELVPPSWDCRQFGTGHVCQFLGLCKREEGWEQPLLGGRFRLRTPHHLDELRQAQGRGLRLGQLEEEAAK